MCPVPSPGGCSGLPPPGGDRTHHPGLPPPAGSLRSCSQPSSFAPGGAVSRLLHGAHLGCAPAAGGSPSSRCLSRRAWRPGGPGTQSHGQGSPSWSQGLGRVWGAGRGASSGPQVALCCGPGPAAGPAQSSEPPSSLLSCPLASLHPFPPKVLLWCSANRTISMATAFNISYVGCYLFRISASQRRPPHPPTPGRQDHTPPHRVTGTAVAPATAPQVPTGGPPRAAPITDDETF